MKLQILLQLIIFIFHCVFLNETQWETLFLVWTETNRPEKQFFFVDGYLILCLFYEFLIKCLIKFSFGVHLVHFFVMVVEQFLLVGEVMGSVLGSLMKSI